MQVWGTMEDEKSEYEVRSIKNRLLSHSPNELVRSGFAMTQSAPASKNAATSSSRAFPVMPTIKRVKP